jgi:hypothetical protein
MALTNAASMAGPNTMDPHSVLASHDALQLLREDAPFDKPEATLRRQDNDPSRPRAREKHQL